jgi:hypothetical protein
MSDIAGKSGDSGSSWQWTDLDTFDDDFTYDLLCPLPPMSDSRNDGDIGSSG